MTDARKNLNRPIIGVGAVVFQGDTILLIKRSKAPRKGEWSLPGGAQELGETAPNAVIREVREETGLTVKITDFIEVIDFIETGENNAINFHYTLLDYAAEVTSGILSAGSDAEDARFFTLDQIASLPLWTETLRIIHKAAHNRGIQ